MLSNQLKILILEDIEEDAELLERALKKEGIVFESLRVDDRPDFIKALTAFKPDLILSDHSLPQFNSLEALEICQNSFLDIPFIIVTGSVSEEFAVSCIKKGADDYVLKSNLARLPVSINVALSQRKMQQKRKEDEELLRKQNEELIKINQELDSFVYSLSHNLKAPLASVLGLINICKIEDKNHNNAFSLYLYLMKESINRLDETIKEILDYSKNARSPLSITTINLESIVNEAFKKARFLEQYADIKKEINIDIPIDFYSDSYRLSLILSSIIANAITYCDAKKAIKTLVIEAFYRDEEIHILIKDNGIGISPEYLPHIYDMFYRATEDSQGAGLGLYIVKETVNKLKGTIKVKSILGEGSTFTLILPYKKEEKIANATL